MKNRLRLIGERKSRSRLQIVFFHREENSLKMWLFSFKQIFACRRDSNKIRPRWNIFISTSNVTKCRFRFLITDIFIYILSQLIFLHKSDSKRFTSKNSFIPSRLILLDLSFKSRINKKKCGILVVETIHLYFLDTCRKTATATVSCKRLETLPYDYGSLHLEDTNGLQLHIAWKTVYRTVVALLAELFAWRIFLHEFEH